jgi:hypothetical protein
MDKAQLENTQQTIATLRQVLKETGKQRGFRMPIFKRDSHGNRLVDHYSRHHSELLAGQVMALANAAEPEHQVVKDLHMGSRDLGPETPVVIYTDDLFALLDHADAAVAKQIEPPAAAG